MYYTQVLLKIPCINKKRRFDNMALMQTPCRISARLCNQQGARHKTERKNRKNKRSDRRGHIKFKQRRRNQRIRNRQRKNSKTLAS